MNYLDFIETPEDVKKLNIDQLNNLCSEIRSFLIESLSHSGGHLSSNLGVVELSVALHKVFNTSVDKLIFDVGHQCYTHKLLTGRAESFSTLRKLDGLSGFQKRHESIHDPFGAGHASTSISAALGMARARTLKDLGHNIIAVIGDGALTGGLAYEALNDAGQSKEPMIVILNDNNMSIQKNVGGVAKQLGRLRLRPQYSKFKSRLTKTMDRLPGGKYLYRFIHNTKVLVKKVLVRGSMFEDMGFTYLGPVDGHDLKSLCSLLEKAKQYSGPVLLHIVTVKGKGYKYSEVDPGAYHGISEFDIDSGKLVKAPTLDFSSVFGAKLAALAQTDPNICAITAAMQSGTGLDTFSKSFPKRFFDVGIAEEHAASMAAGMAAEGLLPVFAVYSTFLQRSYDMLIHDIALQNLHVVLAVDRAGLVGNDGETHQGVFDVMFLKDIPGMSIFAPSSHAELEYMLEHALYNVAGPVAVRYPRGSEGRYKGLSYGTSQTMCSGDDVTIVTYGIVLNEVMEAEEILHSRGINAEVIKLNSLAPLDLSLIKKSLDRTRKLIVVEDCLDTGCIGRLIASNLIAEEFTFDTLRLINLGNCFTPQGTVNELFCRSGLDALSISDIIIKEAANENKIGPAVS